MLNLIRIAAVTGRVDPGSPAGCRKYLTEEIKKAGAHSPDVILLPSDILLPPSAQSLRRQGFMLGSSAARSSPVWQRISGNCPRSSLWDCRFRSTV